MKKYNLAYNQTFNQHPPDRHSDNSNNSTSDLSTDEIECDPVIT